MGRHVAQTSGRFSADSYRHRPLNDTVRRPGTSSDITNYSSRLAPNEHSWYARRQNGATYMRCATWVDHRANVHIVNSGGWLSHCIN